MRLLPLGSLATIVPRTLTRRLRRRATRALRGTLTLTTVRLSAGSRNDLLPKLIRLVRRRLRL